MRTDGPRWKNVLIQGIVACSCVYLATDTDSKFLVFVLGAAFAAQLCALSLEVLISDAESR